MNEQLLKDFLATAKKDNYNWDVILPKFPELKDYDLQLLKDYAATAKKDNYDYSIINPKFPEFNLEEQEGGEPVNFTEGSVEQQEQPTEPLEKPIVGEVNFSPYAVTTTSLAGRNIKKPKTTYDDSFREKFKQLLDEEVEKIDDDKIVSQEEQSDILSKLTKRAEQIEVERAGIEVPEDALFEKTSAQKALDELLVKEFPIDVISEGGRNVSPTIENLEKLKKLDPAFSDYVYNKALKQKNFFDKLEKGQVTERDKYKIMADFNSLKLQDSYDNLQITINENNKIVEDIDKSIEQQKNEMLSTPYFVLDEDGKFSAGIIKTPEQRAEAQSMYNKLSSLIDDKNAQSTSPQYSKNYIDFLNASTKQDALESGEYKDIHKKLKENEIYKEELLDGSWASFGKDLTARLVNGASSFVANSVAFTASMASSYRSLIGADYKYGISDMVVDWAESTSEPFNASERKFTMKDPFTGETKYDAGGLVLSGVDQLGLLFGLAFGNKYSSIKAANKLSKAGITGKRASDAMKISQRWNTFLTGTMASHAQNLRESREMGLSGADLFAYTTFMSTLEGTSELVFPNQNILGKDLKDIALKTFVKNLGKGRKLALKTSLNEVLTAMGSEAAEEYIVLLGKMTQTALISINNEEINTYIPEFEEVIETGAVASLVGGGSTSVIQGYQNITGAKRKEIMSYAISKGTEVDFNGLKTAVAQQVEKENISQYDADSYLLNVHLANNYAKYIPDEIKGKTRQELLPIAQQLDSLIKQSKEKEGVAKKALQKRIKVLEDYMESKIKGESITQTPSYDKPTVFTTPTSERYGTVNRQDGKGDVVLTEEEYNNEISLFEQQQIKEITPTEEVSETVETISPLSERLKNVRVARVGGTFDKGARGEAINEKEIEEAQSVLMDELNEIENSNLPQEQKDAASAEVEKLFNELENYELTTETKTRKITQKRPTRVVREGVEEQTKSPQERSVGRKINIVDGTEFTQEGFAPQEGETIVLEEQDGKIVLQAFDKDGNKTKSQELELENVNDLELVETLKDDDGRVIGATVRNKNNDAEVFSIMDEELALDYAIEKTKAEVGEMSIEEESVFEEYEEVKKRPTKKEPTKEVVEDDSDKIFEQKKSEIESRRRAELEANSRFTGEKVIADQINAKYNAELNRLKAQSQSEAAPVEEVAPTTEPVETATTTEGVETTTDLTEEQVSELNKFLGLDKSKRKASRKGITKKDNQRLDKVERAVDLLEQSLSEVMPNIVISVAEDSDMFARFAGEQEEKKEDRSKGLFTRVDGTYVIVLNPDSADVTTVFHEGLHAVLVAAGLPNTMARAVTSRMVEAVKKTATKKLQRELEAFTELYETPLQSEEYIAELIGILANNYNEQNNETKSIIRRWLQKLAEMLGLKPKGVSLSTVGLNNTDAATIDALNFVAKKMSEGGVLTEQDLTRFTQLGQEAATSLIMEEEISTPGSQILGGTGIRKSKQAKVEDFDTTPPKVDGVKMIYPEKTSIDDVLEKSGGAAIFINSDGTKVGKVTLNGRELILQGGIDYTFIEQNVKDDIGFAASEDKKISQLKTAASELIAERDRKNPEHKGKPIAVFVASQNGETMLGEWYAAEYIMEGLDASIVNKKYKGGLRQAEKDFVKAIKSAKVGKTEDGLRDKKSKDVLLKMVEDGKFKTREGRLDIAKKLASKDFSFGFRVNLNKDLLSNKESASKTGKNVNFKKSLAESGYFLNDFWNRFIDERFLKGIQQQRLQNEKGKTVSKKTFSGFFYDPSESLESQINHAKLGVDHAQFNSSFKSQGNFLLDSAYDVNKLFPLMGYPYQEGIDIYNEANNTKFVKETPKRNPLGLVRATIVDKGMISKWLKENGYSNLIVNPYTSIALSLYTGVSEAGETVTRKQKRQPSERRTERLAPNGKQSNLTDVQYDTVRTPAFKKWFGDWENDPKNASKVVDENGEPLVVYHGSPATEIDVMDRSKSKRISSGLNEFGTYFATNKELSQMYSEAPISKEYKAELTGKLRQLEDELYKSRSNEQFDKINEQIYDLKRVIDGYGGKVYPVFLNLRDLKTFDAKGESNIEAWENLELNLGYKWASGRPAMEALAGKNRMYKDKVDGVKAENIIDMSVGTSDKESEAYKKAKSKYLGDVYLVFDGQPQNIKLADGSNATFDPDAPSIRKQRRKKPKSKVKDAFEWGMQKGVPAIAVKNHLIKLGYTEEEITSGAYDAEKIWNKDGKKVVKWLDYGRRAALSARKFRPQTMFLAKEAMESSISAELRQAKMMAENLNRAINKYKSQDKRDELIDAVDEFMRDAEERDFWRNELPDDIAQIAEAMRVHIDSLSLKLVDSGVIKAESSRENILGNIGVYMNRSYQVFDNKNWKEEVSEQVITAAQNHLREAYYNSLSGISELDQQLKDGKITESEYNRRKNRILSNKASVKEIMDRDNVSEDEALTMHVDDIIDSILSKKDVNEYILFAQPKVGKKDLSSLKRRKDIPPAIRALMGEYTDPGYNYAMSIFKIANLVENQKYLTKIRDAGLGVWLFEKEAGKKIPEGYEQITFEGDASMNPLDGLYAPKEVKEAFNDIELNRVISGIPKIGRLYGYWLKGVGAVKYSKTILSYGTHAKNVIGNMYFMAQNGYLDPREYQQPFIALVKQFSGKELTAEQEAKMDEWVRAGIIGQGATIGEIKSFFEGEDSFEKALTKRIDKKTDNMLSKVGKGVKKFGEKAQEAYQYEDDMFKIVAYEKEKLNYSKILFDGKSYNQLDASQQSTVNDYVAEIIKNILPNYGRIGDFGKGLKAFPIAGTFISFQIEAYRTAYNTVALAIQEIKGDIPGISETGKKLVQKRGVMRLISIVGFQAFKYGLISLLGIPLIPGDDDDEDGLSEKIRTLLPFWDTNSDISVREVKPNGNFTYVSISASDPYGSIFKVVNATKNSAKTGEGFSEIFGELSGPFVSEDILLNTLRNISSNENDYGGKIWRNTDPPFEKSEKIALQLYKTFEPGGITSTRKIIQSENKLNEALGQFTGFKLHEVKSLEQAGFKFGDIQKKAQESKSAYNSIKYNMDDYETQEDINKVIRASKKAMDEDYQEAVKLYQALISLGVSDRDIKKKMYDYGISGPMRSQIARNSVDVKLNPIKK